MSEPDVAVTDYLLTAECLLFSLLIRRQKTVESSLKALFVLLYASLAAASFLGGTVHGFFSTDTVGRGVLWRLTLLSIGITAYACWLIGSRILFEGSWNTLFVSILVLYSAIILFVSQEFWIAIVNYIPSTILLLVAFLVAYRKKRHHRLMLAVAGLSLTFVAAAAQQLEITVHPVYFTFNSLYHAIQAIGLWLIYVGIRPLFAPL